MEKTIKEQVPFDVAHFTAQGNQIYNDKYKADLEKTAKGKYAAIELKSGDCFVEDTMIQAYYKALRKHPNTHFFFVRIGTKGIRISGTKRKKKKQHED